MTAIEPSQKAREGKAIAESVTRTLLPRKWANPIPVPAQTPSRHQ